MLKNACFTTKNIFVVKHAITGKPFDSKFSKGSVWAVYDEILSFVNGSEVESKNLIDICAVLLTSKSS
jgi:hypothetical protein